MSEYACPRLHEGAVPGHQLLAAVGRRNIVVGNLGVGFLPENAGMHEREVCHIEEVLDNSRTRGREAEWPAENDFITRIVVFRE